MGLDYDLKKNHVFNRLMTASFEFKDFIPLYEFKLIYSFCDSNQ